MNTFNAKPKGNVVICILIWLIDLAVAAFAIGTFVAATEFDPENLVFLFAPFIFAVPAAVVTMSYVTARLEVADGKVVNRYAYGFKRCVLEIPLEDVVAVWHYSRTVATGNRLQVLNGCAFKRRDGYVLHLDLATYTMSQRTAFLRAVCAQNSAIEFWENVKNDKNIVRFTGVFEWEAAREETLTEGKKEIAPPQSSYPFAEESQQAPSQEEALNAVRYHYAAYEADGSVKCSVCGARIASAVTPGEHLSGGYVSENGKKWVCKSCWAQFAETYHWTAEE